MTNINKGKKIKELLFDYQKNPDNKNTISLLDHLKSQIASKGHSYEYIVAQLLKNLGYEVLQSQIYRKLETEEDKEETLNFEEIDIEAYKNVDLEGKLGFMGIEKFRICYVIEVKSNAKNHETIFRINESRKYKDNYSPYFPFFSLPFTSHNPHNFHDIERDESYNMGLNDLFNKYENVVASIHVTSVKKVLDEQGQGIKHSYANNGDLVKISNQFKNTFDAIYDNFFDKWSGLSVSNSIFYVVNNIKDKLCSLSNKHNNNSSTTIKDEIEKFYQEFKEEYQFTNDELSFGHEILNQEYNFIGYNIPDNFIKDIAADLKQILTRQKAPVLVKPIVVYQGQSYVFKESDIPYFNENEVVYSFNFRKERHIKKDEYPIFLFNEFNLKEIEKITDYYTQKLQNLNRREYIIYFFDMLAEILSSVSTALKPELF